MLNLWDVMHYKLAQIPLSRTSFDRAKQDLSISESEFSNEIPDDKGIYWVFVSYCSKGRVTSASSYLIL